jgi:hypothetical protein
MVATKSQEKLRFNCTRLSLRPLTQPLQSIKTNLKRAVFISFSQDYFFQSQIFAPLREKKIFF